MIIQEGDTGPQVKDLQQQLGITADGIFGPKTKQAVITFQSAHGLDPDGVVGPLTEAALNGSTPVSGNTPPKPKSPGSKVMGFDIYHGDNVTSWPEIKAGGIKFVAVKATEGLNYLDPSYVKNRAGAKNAGIIFGAYHFIHMDLDGAAQAKYFAQYVNGNGGIDDSDFLMLDWETTNGDPHSVSEDPVTIKAFLDTIKSIMGRRCFVYVGFPMVNAVNNPAFLAEYPFWLADYQSHATVPAPWTNWNVWQTTGDAKIVGMSNPGDSDTFKGNLQDLEDLISYTKV